MTKHFIAVALTFVLAACGSSSDSPRSKLTANDTASVATDATVSTVRSSVSMNPSLQDLVVEIRIHNSATNDLYAYKVFSPVSIPAGSQQTLTFDYQSAASATPPFGPGWRRPERSTIMRGVMPTLPPGPP
ncbi:MAG: hypothetical protein ACJ8AT_03910 [Hyalangium sp.]|uniref:hypothetical protein n=1 Tax=Hyalangium sp. TaxID=2028555 RepID=UPI003899B192